VELLRHEILEAQKARSDLLKWKVVLVAALGTVGLGLNPGGHPHRLLLVGVPFVCGYVDLLCHHLNLRIQLIASFIRECPEANITETGLILKRYEDFVAGMGDRPFSLETWALRQSSLLLSAAVSLYALSARSNEPSSTTLALSLAGVFGIALTMGAHRVYQQRRKTIGTRSPTPHHERILVS
jgi:hypothetical protein